MVSEATAAATAQRPAVERTNVLSIVAIIGGFTINVVGIICGIIALRQIGNTGEKGRGLALTGIVAGSLSLILGVVLTFAYISVMAVAITEYATY